MACIPQFTCYNVFIGLCFIAIFVLSLLGNSVIILVIIKLQRRTTRSITNMLLLNLAIADLLRSLICIPPTLMSEISQCWLLGPYVCKFAAYLQPVTVCASAYTLVLIALERYYAICRPLELMIWLSKRRLFVLISFVWFVAFASNIGALVIYDAIPYRTHWNCRSTASPLIDFFYQIHVTLDSANDLRRKNAPSCSLCSASRKYNARKNATSSSNSASAFRSSASSKAYGSYECGYMLRSNRQEKIIEAKRRVIRMLIIIVIAFVICWTPSFIWWLTIRTTDLIRSAINQYSLRRPKFMTQYNDDLLSNESNVERAVAIPFLSNDNV
ncbi:unnamed protein product [Onchocerca ochengi]|uniref:G_PROTEIN_RECEP_F1_2 domain-containing protein n=1 Tax=Onchocerca ochengi TaxID=42157 RepID=A0A182E5A5_ONCOC|nr:unnamed protein product [Onchocerca ochengi]